MADPDAATTAAWAIHNERLFHSGENCACQHPMPRDLAFASVALEAARPLIEAEARAAERQRIRAVLAEHYLMTVICDHENKRDNPVCACSRVFLGWHPTVGAAVQAWIDHVADLLDGDDDE